MLHRAFKEKGRNKTERRKLRYITCQSEARSSHKLPFSDNNFGRQDFRLENVKSTSAIFFCILLQVHTVLSDRRVIKSQTTTDAMTFVLYGRDSF